jgi:hypothetical protein
MNSLNPMQDRPIKEADFEYLNGIFLNGLNDSIKAEELKPHTF